jgi:flagellar biosynthesis/type III secretory pathway M-ring protein FliF/YscJ
MQSNRIGRGFPATFGFVIAALLVVGLAQFLALRERRNKTQEALVESQLDESSSEIESKSAGVPIRSHGEIGEDLDEKKAE